MSIERKSIEEQDVEFGVDSRYLSDYSKRSDGESLMKARIERMEGFSEDDIKRAKLLQFSFRNK